MKKFLFIAVLVLFCSSLVSASGLGDYCQKIFDEEKKCPGETCVMVVSDDFEDEYTKQVCQAKPCDEISAEECPLDFCDQMINCRDEEICNFKMIDPPECGNLSYAGQDVPCCEGLVRRCGVAFLDDTCDMYGDDSEYNIPICIPCGDGVCTNFENVCNCPEDCVLESDSTYKGQLFGKEKPAKEVSEEDEN